MTDADGPGIALRDLHKTFKGPDGPVPAVRGVDLEIAPGETVALLGPNGAGKSTTIDMLLGLLTPDGGEARLFGGAPADAVAAGRVGAMLQTGSLVEYITVRELVATLGALYPDPMPIDEVLAAAGCTDFAKQMTNKLSGGQTQRVRLALALVGNPDLLVLDEPTVALDVSGRRDFWARMRELALGGRTVVFATHYLEEADDFADRVVLMARGKVVADGPTTEIKARVGARVIRATLPGIAPAALEALAGVVGAERHGDAVELRCSDSDAALRALLRDHDDARDIEVRGADLEDAFLELTA